MFCLRKVKAGKQVVLVSQRCFCCNKFDGICYDNPLPIVLLSVIFCRSCQWLWFLLVAYHIH